MVPSLWRQAGRSLGQAVVRANQQNCKTWKSRAKASDEADKWDGDDAMAITVFGI